MRALRMAKAERWWRGEWGGGWTVAFSGADKSKKERAVINVPKWPRVTDRPSPVTALKIGHLHNHPSHTRTQTHSHPLPSSVCVCMCTLMCVYVRIKQKCYYNYLIFKANTHRHMQGSISISKDVKDSSQALIVVDACTYKHPQVCHFLIPRSGHWTLGGMTDHLKRTYDLHFSAALSLGPDSQTQMHY